MKLIEYTSYGKYSKIGIIHSVLVKGQEVWSWEFQYPLISKGNFHVYKLDEWKDDVKEIHREQKIKDFDLEPYHYVSIRSINCVEVLDKIVRENKAGFVVPLGFYVYRRLSFAFSWVFATIILMIGAFLYGYYGFSISEEDYLDSNYEICQD